MPIQQSGEMSPFADRLATCVSGGQGMTGLSCPDAESAHLNEKRLMWSPVASVAPRDLFRAQTTPLLSVKTWLA